MQTEQARELRDALSRAIEHIENKELEPSADAKLENGFLIY